MVGGKGVWRLPTLDVPKPVRPSTRKVWYGYPPIPRPPPRQARGTELRLPRPAHFLPPAGLWPQPPRERKSERRRPSRGQHRVAKSHRRCRAACRVFRTARKASDPVRPVHHPDRWLEPGCRDCLREPTATMCPSHRPRLPTCVNRTRVCRPCVARMPRHRRGARHLRSASGSRVMHPADSRLPRTLLASARGPENGSQYRVSPNVRARHGSKRSRRRTGRATRTPSIRVPLARTNTWAKS